MEKKSKQGGRGGARLGAGRPRKLVKLGPIGKPRDLLEAILRNDECSPAVRLQAAKALLALDQRVIPAEVFEPDFIKGP